MYRSRLSRRRAPAPGSGHRAQPVARPDSPSFRRPRSSTPECLFRYPIARSDRVDCGPAAPRQVLLRPISAYPTTTGVRPSSRALPAAASKASRLLAITSRLTPANAWSPGFGVSGRSPASTESTRDRPASGSRRQMPACSNCSRTSRAVVGSGTHGPDPMEARSSPITSEITYPRTLAGARARASFPPPQRENRLRIRFIAVMSSPEPRSRE